MDTSPLPPPPARAWRLHGGAATVIDIPPDGFLVPGIQTPALCGTPMPVRLYGPDGWAWETRAPEDWRWQTFTVSLLTDLVGCIAPWATVWAAPGWTGSAEGNGDRWGGQAWGCEGVALVRSSAAPTHALGTCLHELWHLCEEHVDPGVLAALDARLAEAGPAYPGDYHPRPCERRARAFETFGLYLIEGGRLAATADTPEAVLFGAVFSGAFGADLVAAWNAPPPRPGLLARVRGAIGGLRHAA